MRLLFDQNLHPHLVDALKDEFPGSAHVHPLGLGEADDIRIWEFAKAEDFVIASKDSDFAAMSVLRGAPPKVIWIALGNCQARWDLYQVERDEADELDEIREHRPSNREPVGG